jgi:hypothetical protein
MRAISTRSQMYSLSSSEAATGVLKATRMSKKKMRFVAVSIAELWFQPNARL